MEKKSVILVGWLLLVCTLALQVSPAAAQPCFPSGDVDGTGQLTPADALQAFRHFLGLVALDECPQLRANVDDPETTEVTPGDALCIFQRFLNQQSCLGPPQNMVSGVVSKGPVAGAMITLFTMAPDGSPDRPVASATGDVMTDASGEWVAMLPANEVGPLLAIATGGTYFDETTGMGMPVGPQTDLMGLVPVPLEGMRAAITPLTHALVMQVEAALQTAMAAGEMPDMELLVNRVVANATTEFGFDPVRTMPPDPRDLAGRSPAEVQYAAILGGISQLLMEADARFSMRTLLQALARDLADGVVDGRQAGQEIRDTGGMVIPSLIANPQTTTLADVANTFATNPPTDTGLDRAMLRCVIAGLDCATPTMPRPVVMAPLPPTVVNCRVPQMIFEGDPTDLGLTALDVSGTGLMFAWQQQPMTPAGIFSTPEAATTQWTAPTVEANTPVTIQVTVTDGRQLSNICQVMVTVRNTSPFILNVSRLNDRSQRLQ